MAFQDEHHRQVVDSLDTAKILKESLEIVDKLAKMDADDIFANDDDLWNTALVSVFNLVADFLI